MLLRHASLALVIALALTPTAFVHAEPFAYITNQGSHNVSVIDLASQKVVATMPVGRSPAGVAASNCAGRVFVSNPDSKTISVIVFKSMALTTALGALFSSTVLAHGPTRQKAVEKIAINAPPNTVWAKIRNFDALQDWHPAVTESSSDKGNIVGSVRHLKLKGDGELSETLESYDDARMKYSYRAKDGGALPVSNYTSTISVSGEGSQSVVEWRGAFYRGYPNNDPPPDKNDEAAVKAITGVYKGGLENLKKLVEGS